MKRIVLAALTITSLSALFFACKKSSSPSTELSGSYVTADYMQMAPVRLYTASGSTIDTSITGPVSRRMNASFIYGGSPFINYASTASRPFSATYTFTFTGNTATFSISPNNSATCDILSKSDDFVLLARCDSTTYQRQYSRCESMLIASFRDRRDSTCFAVPTSGNYTSTLCRLRPLFPISIEGEKRFLNLMSLGIISGNNCSVVYSNTSGRFDAATASSLQGNDSILVQEKKLELLRQ